MERKEQAERAARAQKVHAEKQQYKWPKDGRAVANPGVGGGYAAHGHMSTEKALKTWDQKNKHLYPKDPVQRGGGYGYSG